MAKTKGAGKLPIASTENTPMSVTGQPVSGQPAETPSETTPGSGTYIPTRRDAGNPKFAGVITPEEAWASTKPFFDMYRKEYGDTLKKNKSTQQIADWISAITGGAALLKGASSLTGISAKDVYKQVADWIKGQGGSGSSTGASGSSGTPDYATTSESDNTLGTSIFEGVGGIDPSYSNDSSSYDNQVANDNYDLTTSDGGLSTSDTVVDTGDFSLNDNAFDSSNSSDGGGWF